MSWLEKNWAAIEAMLSSPDNRTDDPFPAPPLAVFDWDNTCALNDIGEATFYRMVDRLGIPASEAFYALIPEEVGGRARRSPIRKAREQLKASPEDVTAMAAWRLEMLRLYRDLFHFSGAQAAYEWLLLLYAGRTREEARRLGEEALAEETTRPVLREVIPCPDEARGIELARGIRIFPEMVRLADRLRAAGFEIFVVSASAEWIVQPIARSLGFDPSHVIGARLAEHGGVLVPEIERPFPYGPGKLEAIDRFIGRRPDFVAGDSEGDLDMLAAARRLALVIDRGLVRVAAEARHRGWLMQPRFEVPR